MYIYSQTIIKPTIICLLKQEIEVVVIIAKNEMAKVYRKHCSKIEKKVGKVIFFHSIVFQIREHCVGVQILLLLNQGAGFLNSQNQYTSENAEIII